MRQWWVVLVFLALASCAMAQLDRATLTGTIFDPSGAVVPGAKVELTSPDTGLRREVLSSGAGSYTFAGLPIGTYNVAVSFKGLTPISLKNVRLTVGETRTEDITFQKVAGGTTVVSVEAEAIPLQRDGAGIGSVIGGNQLREMPVNGRDWAALMLLAPGAVNTGSGNMGDIRFSGRSNDDNNFMFDGVDASGVKDQTMESDLRLVVSQDAIAEFRVNSTLYTAETGAGGGAQINLVSKSGTNQWHGGLFEFLRNDVLDAQDYFDDSAQPLRLNQFGGNIGGPIIKNKTFFFANYEGLRQRVAHTYEVLVPSAAFRARATNPGTLTILKAYPLGSAPTKDPNADWYYANRSNTWNEDSGLLKIDHRFNASNSIYARYSTDKGAVSEARTGLPGDSSDPYTQPTHFVLQYQHLFGPRVINEWKGGVNREPLDRFTRNAFPDGVTIPGFTTLNTHNEALEIGTSYSMLDNLAITRGRHTLKIGGEIRRAHVNVADPLNPSISVTYANATDFLNNKLTSFSSSAGNAELGTRKWFYFAYVQDDFKWTPQFTMNLGLRYEYYGVNSEAHNRYRIFDLFEFGGFGPQSAPWYDADRNNFDPRVGFAWAPKALKGKTVIRFGAGVFHGPGQVDDANTALDNYATGNFSLTNAEAPTLSYPVTPFLDLAKSAGITPRSLQRHNRRDLYVEQWGMSIQQDLPAGFMGQIAYSGSSGHHQFARIDINRLDLVTRKRPYPAFGRIDQKNQLGNGHFNALQLSLHRRAASGLTWGTEYMWGHSINDGSTGAGEGDRPQNSDCRACDKASGGYDIRQTITSFWTYQFPFGAGKKFLNNGAAARVFGGWEMSGTWAMRTGRPLNISMSRSTNDLPDGNSRSPRPDYVAGADIYAADKSFDHWLNSGAFRTPASRVWGNLGRMIGRGPGMAQVDFSLQKSNKITEGKSIILRAEFYNIFNRVNAANPGTNWSSPGSFGVITSSLNSEVGTGTPRQIQLAVRFRF